MAEEKTTDPPPPANTAKDDAEPSTSDAGTEEASNTLEDNFSQTDTTPVETPRPPRASQDSTVVAEAAAAAPIEIAGETSEDQGNKRVSDKCGKVIGHPPDMKRPSGTPTVEGPCDCDESGRSSLPNDACAQRRRRPTCKRHYNCEECTSSYLQRLDLAQHRRRHTSECLFECPECGSHFVRRGNLDSHLTIDHHKCRVCPATFAEISGLAAHLISHSLDLM